MKDKESTMKVAMPNSSSMIPPPWVEPTHSDEATSAHTISLSWVGIFHTQVPDNEASTWGGGAESIWPRSGRHGRLIWKVSSGYPFCSPSAFIVLDHSLGDHTFHSSEKVLVSIFQRPAVLTLLTAVINLSRYHSGSGLCAFLKGTKGK